MPTSSSLTILPLAQWLMQGFCSISLAELKKMLLAVQICMQAGKPAWCKRLLCLSTLGSNLSIRLHLVVAQHAFLS